MDSVNTEPTAIEDDYDALYAEHLRKLNIFDRARLSLLRRAVVDRDLSPASKLLLFILAERANPLSYEACLRAADLEQEAGLDTKLIDPALTALRKRGYLSVKCRDAGHTYLLGMTRLVTGGAS